MFPSALLCACAALTAMCHTEKAGGDGAGRRAINAENAVIKVDGKTSTGIRAEVFLY